MSLGGKKLSKKDQLAVALSGEETKKRKKGRSLIQRAKAAARFNQPEINLKKD